MEKINRREFLTKTAALAFAGTSALGFFSGCERKEIEPASAENARKVLKWLLKSADQIETTARNQIFSKKIILPDYYGFSNDYLIKGGLYALPKNNELQPTFLSIEHLPFYDIEGDRGFEIYDDGVNGLHKTFRGALNEQVDIFNHFITTNGIIQRIKLNSYNSYFMMSDGLVLRLNNEYNAVLKKIIQTQKIE